MRLGFAVVIAVSAWCGSVQPTAACSIAAPEPFAIDPSLVGIDTTPPPPFRELQAHTRQISGTHCEGKICTSSSCGDEAVIELSFAAREANVGYRVIWRGDLPAGVTSPSDGIAPLTEQNTIVLHIAFDAITQLDGELSLIAVDHAGNESEPSAPIHVSWSGCLSYFDAPDRCVQHTESCTIAAPGAGHSRRTLPLMAAGLVGLVLGRRWRHVGRRRRV